MSFFVYLAFGIMVIVLVSLLQYVWNGDKPAVDTGPEMAMAMNERDADLRDIFLEFNPGQSLSGMENCYMVLEAWKGFQTRQGPYTSVSSDEPSDGYVTVHLDPVEENGGYVYSQAQFDSLRYLHENQENLRDKILDAVVKYYTDLMEEMGEDFEDYNSEAMPVVKSREDLMDMIGLSTLHVMEREKDGFVNIGYEFGCMWDEEHGMGVMTRKDMILEVGQADTSFSGFIGFEDEDEEDQA